MEEKKCKYSLMCSDFRKLRPPVALPETRLPSVPAEHTQMDAQIGSRKGVKCGLKEDFWSPSANLLAAVRCWVVLRCHANDH